MNLATTTYRGIDIRYGCDIVTAEFYAHFVLPPREDIAGGFQREVRMDMSPRPQPGKDRVRGDSEEQMLEKARARIDQYLGADR